MNIIWFFAGIMIGSMVGVVLMCLLQINRHNPENKQQLLFTVWLKYKIQL